MNDYIKHIETENEGYRNLSKCLKQYVNELETENRRLIEENLRLKMEVNRI